MQNIKPASSNYVKVKREQNHMARGPEQDQKGKPRAAENVASEQLQKVLSPPLAFFAGCTQED